MSLINQITIEDLGKAEIIPLNLTFTNVPTSPDTNAVLTALRFDMNNAEDTGTDISANTAVSTNEVSLSDIWVSGDTRVDGYFRLQVILATADSSIKEEMNLLVTVVD